MSTAQLMARAADLIRLAERTDPDDPDEHLLAAASRGAQPPLRERWVELVAAVHTLERLRAGVVDWTAVDDELIGPDRGEAADVAVSA